MSSLHGGEGSRGEGMEARARKVRQPDECVNPRSASEHWSFPSFSVSHARPAVDSGVWASSRPVSTSEGGTR